MKKSISLLLISSLIFAACSAPSLNKRIAEVKAQSICISLNNELSQQEKLDKVDQVLAKNGFTEGEEEIKMHITSMEGTTDYNELNTMIRENITNTCEDEIKEKGLSIPDLTEAILTE